MIVQLQSQRVEATVSIPATAPPSSGRRRLGAATIIKAIALAIAVAGVLVNARSSSFSESTLRDQRRLDEYAPPTASSIRGSSLPEPQAPPATRGIDERLSRPLELELPPPPMLSTIELMNSEHVVDCAELVNKKNKDESDPGRWKEITLTNPSFQISIHNPRGDSVSRTIDKEGCWECPHVKDLLQVLNQYEDSYFLDVGGNLGMWTLAAAAEGHQTFTVEALPRNAEKFCSSVIRNGFEDRTHLMNVAATDAPGYFELKMAHANLGGTIVVPLSSEHSPHADDVIQGVRLDSLMLPVDLPLAMKIDVEGHELNVLKGAMQFLKQANVVYVAMELRPGLHKDRLWKGVFRLLQSKGLKPYRVNYEDETELDVERVEEWKHFKHPAVRYFDVVWRRDDFDRGTRTVHPM